MGTEHLQTAEARARSRSSRRPAVKWRAAVNAKCKDCIFDPMSGLGTWQQQVRACEIRECPLWAIRVR